MQDTWVPVGIGIMVLTVLLGGCRPEGSIGATAGVASVRFAPDPPRVGTNEVTIELTDPSGKALSIGALEVEANMNHAGMRPVFTRLQEVQPGSGRYEGTISFTMGGDWFLLLTGEGADGTRVDLKVSVPGVKTR